MTRYIDADALMNDAVIHRSATTNESCITVDAVDDAPTIDAIPIEFIQKRIDQLKEINERIFMANGGYTSPSDYEQWELERLIRDWREQND